MKRLLARLCLGTVFITALPANSFAICQHCVNEYWNCLWAAQQTAVRVAVAPLGPVEGALPATAESQAAVSSAAIPLSRGPVHRT